MPRVAIGGLSRTKKLSDPAEDPVRWNLKGPSIGFRVAYE
jgi:hypothetical protein